MKKYLCSKHIKKKDIPEEVNNLIAKDLKLFNEKKRKIFSDACKGVKHPHTELKNSMKCSDYFVTALEGAVKMTLSSQKELLSLYINDAKQDIEDMKNKIASLKNKKADLLKMKQGIINYTKSGCKNRKLICNFKSSGVSFRQDGSVKVGFGKHVTIFQTVFAFEHEWLDPKIKRVSQAEKNIRPALRRKQHRLEKLERQREEKCYSVYFGSRKLMHDTEMPDAQRRKMIHQKRECSMTLSGRLDATDGNFMVHYDIENHRLYYRGSRTENEFLDVGEITFGRKDTDSLIREAFQTKTPKAWTIVDCGNAWRFDLCLTFPDDSRVNDYYGNGCIGIDMNSGHLGVVETDACGNPRRRKIFRFPMEGRSSEQNKQAISKALERVFLWAKEKNKPIAAEDIGNVNRKAGRYSTEARKNRSVSMFPSDIIRQMIESKSHKYSIAVTFVNPAYTSQVGKIKYLAQYGMSIHESAALTIARRAMGFTERLPDFLRPFLEPKQQNKVKTKKKQDKNANPIISKTPQLNDVKSVQKPKKQRKSIPLILQWRIAHWKKAYPITKKWRPHEMYEWKQIQKKNLYNCN